MSVLFLQRRMRFYEEFENENEFLEPPTIHLLKIADDFLRTICARHQCQ